jgi:hypothetical protein
MPEPSYGELGPTVANIAIGVLGAAFDNIPLMFAVLTMNPDMSSGQWMLVTLSTGVGGSLVSIGSAAGVVLMGLARNHYTFFNHLRWAWAICARLRGEHPHPSVGQRRAHVAFERGAGLSVRIAAQNTA